MKLKAVSQIGVDDVASFATIRYWASRSKLAFDAAAVWVKMYSKIMHVRSYSMRLLSMISGLGVSSRDCDVGSGFSTSAALMLLSAVRFDFATTVFNARVNTVAIDRWMDEVPRTRMGGANVVRRNSEV